MTTEKAPVPETPAGEASYDPAWDIAVKCRKNGQSDIEAIEALAQFMRPPAPLQSIAKIIGAIYADSYWVRTKMDYSLLSAALQQAGGWNKPDCDIAAWNTFLVWYGLRLRNDFFSSTDPIPKHGALASSPDVLCNAGTPLDKLTMITQWNSLFYNMAPGTKNYVYGRVQSINLPVPITKPTLRMFVTDGGFNQPPTSWTILYTFDTHKDVVPLKGIEPGPILAGGRAASQPGFNFQPLGVGHYCLIAVAGTEFFRNNPLEGSGNWNSVEWNLYNGAVGWHNMSIVKGNGADVLKFYNQDGRPEVFAFEAHCVNVPEGTEISLGCDHARLARALDSGPVKIARAYQVVSVEGETPANFSGDLSMRIVTPDQQPLPAEAWIEVRMLWHLSPGHPHYAQAAELKEFARAGGQPITLQLGAYTLVGATE